MIPPPTLGVGKIETECVTTIQIFVRRPSCREDVARSAGVAAYPRSDLIVFFANVASAVAAILGGSSTRSMMCTTPLEA